MEVCGGDLHDVGEGGLGGFVLVFVLGRVEFSGGTHECEHFFVCCYRMSRWREDLDEDLCLIVIFGVGRGDGRVMAYALSHARVQCEVLNG